MSYFRPSTTSLLSLRLLLGPRTHLGPALGLPRRVLKSFWLSGVVLAPRIEGFSSTTGADPRIEVLERVKRLDEELRKCQTGGQIEQAVAAGLTLQRRPDLLSVEILKTAIRHFQRIKDLDGGFQFVEGVRRRVMEVHPSPLNPDLMPTKAPTRRSFLTNLLPPRWRKQGIASDSLPPAEISLTEFNDTVSMALLDAAIEAADAKKVVKAMGLLSPDLTALNEGILTKPLARGILASAAFLAYVCAPQFSSALVVLVTNHS